MKEKRLQSFISEWVLYTVIFSGLWVLLTQGDYRSIVIGAVAIPGSALCAVLLSPRAELRADRLTVLRVVKFLPFFLTESVKGGWESALFAILPSRTVKPHTFFYKTRLPEGRATTFFINIISLLPGTLTADTNDNVLTIHVLDRDANNLLAITTCETRIAELFGIDLTR